MVRYVPLGQWCVVAQQLKDCGRRDEAYPFDWAFSCPMHILHMLPKIGGDRISRNHFYNEPPNIPRYEDEIHSTFALPHIHDMNGEDSFQRACDRFYRLFEETPEDGITFVHVFRPEDDWRWHERTQMIFDALQNANPEWKTWKLLSIINVPWSRDGHPPENRCEFFFHSDRMCKVMCHVSHEWFGCNWNGSAQQGLWHQIFETYEAKYETSSS